MKSLTAVLFAGGESRRMGVDKAMLELGGEPLWARQLRTLRELHPEQMLVSARSRPVWCPSDVEAILDQSPSLGPLSGLAAVLATLKTSHALMLALDMPQMPATYLHRLWEQCDERSGVIPQNTQAYEPLGAIYPAAAFNTVESALNGDDHSLHRVIDQLVKTSWMQVRPIQASERAHFLNLNTPVELAALRSQLAA